jgi:hypothetical protein
MEAWKRNNPFGTQMNADYLDHKYKLRIEQVPKIYLLSYPEATDIEIGLVHYFCSNPEVRRNALNNSKK